MTKAGGSRGHTIVAALAVAVAVAVAGCGRTELDPPFPLPTGFEIPIKPVFDQSVNSDLDIIFMIDNSYSMKEEQDNLARNFPVFMAALEGLPEGVPNVHIGVVSSDLGTGRYEAPGCTRDGDGGAFHVQQPSLIGTCAGAPMDTRYLSAIGNQRNFEGNISDAFACIARLGTGGCGFEHQLGAVRRALGGDPQGVPPENKGFLRDGALLAIVLITDEDDCSAPADSDLFDPRQVYLSDPYGPLDSYRCNEFGHLCDGVPPPRTLPGGASMTALTDCRSNENGKLVAVRDFVAYFKSLKENPADVIVAAIAGPSTPYAVKRVQAEVLVNNRRTGVYQSEPRIVASCGVDPMNDPAGKSNGLAFPGVRIKEFIDAFGNNGTFESICDGDFSPAMADIGEAIAGRIRHQCVAGPLVDVDPVQAGIQPNCEVFEQIGSADGVIRSRVRSCADSAAPCWHIRPDETCPTGKEIVVDRASIPAAPRTRIVVICETCKDPDDPSCPKD